MVPPAQDGAVLNGRVLDAEGKPVMGVTVFTSRIDAQTDAPLTVGRERTGIDGYFSFSGLAPATYRLCIDPEGKQYLDPCEWSEEPVTVQLERNGLIQNLEVLVEDAGIVTIEVEDQADVLGKFARAEAARIRTETGSATATPKAQGALILGLRTRTGNLSMARLAAVDKETKKLRYRIPAPERRGSRFRADAGESDSPRQQPSRPGRARRGDANDESTNGRKGRRRGRHRIDVGEEGGIG